MSKRAKVLLLVLIAIVFALGVALGAAMNWYSSITPPRPTSRPGASLPWYDDFSDPSSGWQTETDADAEVGYRDDALQIWVKETNLLAWAFAGHQFADFRLAVDATQVDGPDDNMYGALVRIRNRDNFYRFSISGDGYYMVDKHTDGVWTRLTAEWPESAAIRTGSATNHIEIVCQGETMTFLVNGVQLAQIQDSDHRAGDIGLYAGTVHAKPDVQVRFDNLAITVP